MDSIIATNKIAERAQRRWDRIVERFRRACILHKKGQTADAERITRDELPLLVKAWIQILPNSLKDAAKADLRDMFIREQALVDQSARLEKVFKETLIHTIIPELEARIAAKYRAIYLKGYELRRQARERRLKDRGWIEGDNGLLDDEKEARRETKRIPISEVADMIDALEYDEMAELAESLLSVDEILSSLDAEEIEPLALE